MAMSSHTIPISQVHNILQGARYRGLNVEPVLNRAGIPISLLGSSRSRISQIQYASLLTTLQRTMRDEYWGLCRQPVHLGTFAQCCEILIHCRTLGEALRAGTRFYHLVLPEFTVRIQRQGGLARVRIHAQSPGSARLDYAERVFAFFMFGLSSWLIEKRLPVSRVLLRCGPSTQKSETGLLFQAPVCYDQSHNGFLFDARWLDCAIQQDATSLRAFLKRVPRDLLVKYRDSTRVSERIRRHLRQHLADGPIAIEEVALAIGMTPHTLRRRLRQEGERYQQLKDDLRRDTAIEYLACPSLSLLDIAERLGFSEPSTFHRAFKKWTGLPPGEYRQTVLDETATGFHIPPMHAMHKSENGPGENAMMYLTQGLRLPAQQIPGK